MRVLGYHLGGYVSYAHQIVGTCLHGKGAAANAAANERIVDHHAAMGQHFASAARNEEQGRHACRHTQAYGTNGAAYRLHHVVKRQPRLHFAAWAVDEQRDGGMRILLLQVKQAADGARHRLRADCSG